MKSEIFAESSTELIMSSTFFHEVAAENELQSIASISRFGS